MTLWDQVRDNLPPQIHFRPTTTSSSPPDTFLFAWQEREAELLSRVLGHPDLGKEIFADQQAALESGLASVPELLKDSSLQSCTLNEMNTGRSTTLHFGAVRCGNPDLDRARCVITTSHQRVAATDQKPSTGGPVMSFAFRQDDGRVSVMRDEMVAFATEKVIAAVANAKEKRAMNGFRGKLRRLLRTCKKKMFGKQKKENKD